MRILIWFLVYMSVVIGLPRLKPVSDLIASTDGVGLKARLVACAIAAALGLVILALSRKHAAEGGGYAVLFRFRPVRRRCVGRI